MARKNEKKDAGSENGVLEMDRPEAEAAHEPVTTLEDGSEVRFESSSPPVGDHIEVVEPPAAEAAPPPPAEPEPDPLWAKLVERQKEADALHGEYTALAEEAKQKKKEWEGKVEEVASLIRRSTKPMPLFEKPRPAEPFEAEDEPEIDGAATLLQIAPGTEADRDGWKTTGVAELVEHGMPKKYVKILAESEVHTIGDIQALGEKHKDVTDLKGVGESARDKIYDALDSFWAAHPEYAELPAELLDDEPPAADAPDGDDFEETAEDGEDAWGEDDVIGVAEDEGGEPEGGYEGDDCEDEGSSYDETDPERGDD